MGWFVRSECDGKRKDWLDMSENVEKAMNIAWSIITVDLIKTIHEIYET